MWVERAAEVEQELSHGVDLLGRADHRAGDDVAVPVEVLGGTVDHQVDADLARPEVDRRGEGTVDHRDQIVGA